MSSKHLSLTSTEGAARPARDAATIKAELENLKMERFTSLQPHFAKLNEIFAELVAAGAGLNEKQKIYALVQSLIDEYQPIAKHIALSMGERPSCVKVQKAMMAMEQCMMVSCQNQPTRCHSCGEMGHSQATCFLTGDDNAATEEMTMCSLSSSDEDEQLPQQPLWSGKWVVDAVVTHHITNDKDILWNFKPITCGHRVDIDSTEGGEINVQAAGVGTVKLRLGVNTLELEDVLYAPNMYFNIMSTIALDELYECKWSEGKVKLFTKEGRLLGFGKRYRKKYVLECRVISPHHTSTN